MGLGPLVGRVRKGPLKGFPRENKTTVGDHRVLSSSLKLHLDILDLLEKLRWAHGSKHAVLVSSNHGTLAKDRARCCCSRVVGSTQNSYGDG